MRHEKLATITTGRQMKPYNISKRELKKLMEVASGTDLVRCIYALHYIRTKKRVSLKSYMEMLGRTEDRTRRRDILNNLGYVIVGDEYKVKAYSKTLRHTRSRGWYTFQGEIGDSLCQLEADRVAYERDRIYEVQFIDGAVVDVPSDIMEAEMVRIESELLVETNRKKLDSLKYKKYANTEIMQKSPRIHTYKKSGCTRLYTSFTNMSKHYKAYLKDYRGEHMVGVDITASQPRLFTTVLKNILENEFEIWDFLYKIMEIPSDDISIVKDDYVQAFSNWKIEVLKDLDKFDTFIDGDFYENIAIGTNCDRDGMKGQFMWYVNDFDDKIPFQYALMTKMEKELPTLNEYMKALKGQDSYSRKNKDSKRYSISNKLSKLEADIILRGIVKKFRKLQPNENVITVHDSINVNPSNLNVLIPLIEQEFKLHKIPLKYKIEIHQNNIILKDNKKIQEYITLKTHNTTPHNKPQINNTIPTNVVPSPSLSLQNSQSQRNRESQMKTLKDGRLTISIKNKQINSRKGESLEEFEKRINLIKGELQ
jgi:hypothetical protein